MLVSSTKSENLPFYLGAQWIYKFLLGIHHSNCNGTSDLETKIMYKIKKGKIVAKTLPSTYKVIETITSVSSNPHLFHTF